MAYHVEGQVYLALFFNGEEFPFNKVNTFERLHVAESIKVGLPLLNLTLVDGQKWMLRKGFVADNARIRVTFGPGSDDPRHQQTMEFRLVSLSDSTLTSGSSRYIINALLDTPRFISSSMTDPLNGTSSEALKKIADYCGLEYEGVGTSDSQAWRPSNQRIYKFARHIVERGYASENSCMTFGVTAKKKLIYRDISSMESPAGTFGLKDLTGTTGIPTSSFAPDISSGINNQMIGMGLAVVEQALGKESVNRIHRGISSFINDGGDLLQNQALKVATGLGLTRYSPIDNGANNHAKSERARYQNERGLSMFSSTLSLTCPVVTGINLLDTAAVSTANIEPADPSYVAYSGKYRVLHKVSYLEPGQYTEKFVLSRRTLNITLPESVQLGSSPGGSPGNSQAATSEKTVEIPAPIKSLANFLGFDPAKAVETYDKVMTTLNDQNFQQAVVLGAAIVTAVSKMNSVPTVRPPLDALLARIRSLETEGVAAINQQKASVPIGDPDNTLPPIALDYKTRIETAISEATPEIEGLAQRTLRVTSSTKNIAAGQSAAASSATKFNSVSSSVGSALKAFGSPPGFTETVESSSAAYASAAESTVSSTDTAASSASAAADSLETDATTYPQIIESQKSTSVTSLNAATQYT